MYVPVHRPNNHVAKDARLYNLRKKGPDYKVGKHFTLGEFACRDGTPVVMLHPALVYHLDALRTRFGAVYVTSGFRTGSHNKAEGGKDNSVHLWGGAADVVVEDTAPRRVRGWAKGRGFGGIGRYDDFTHLDVWGERRRWSG